MKSATLKVVSNSCSYNQNPQNANIQFSLLNRDGKGFKELHYHVKCREYFGDSLLAAKFDKDLPNIYGFKLINKRQCLEHTLISASIYTDTHEGIDHYNQFLKGVKILRKLEKTMGIPLKERSEYRSTDKKVDGSSKIVIISPKEWQHSPMLLSLYTFILRLTTYIVPDTCNSFKLYANYVHSNFTGTDKNYITTLNKIDFDFLLKNYIEIMGDAPLTGLDDTIIASNFNENSSDTSYGFNYDASRYEGASSNQEASFSTYNNHARHGIITFANSVTGEAYTHSPREIGFKWACNYKRLKDKANG